MRAPHKDIQRTPQMNLKPCGGSVRRAVNTARTNGKLVLGVLSGALLGGMLLSGRRFSFYRRTVLITGGSRGLGLVMARQLAAAGARLALVARDERELERARRELIGAGAEVLALPCDVRVQADVNAAVQEAVKHFGGIDVLINNAGVIQVGPFQQMTIKDFEDALAVHLFGPLFFTLAVLPDMRRRGTGRLVNISSVGGKIAVPHLLPYTVSKFALVGLSDGLRAELRRENILVTTVCPGLMRTGSHGNGGFKGKRRLEYAWFTIADSLPVLSVSAENAARQILNACRKGQARLVIGSIPGRPCC